mmetsp:Transcript_7083/g.23472  ORF Transcript_7083/g.23472 Transcript_7083/m.23472 type:complete len:225 (-) Transcript_7083:107-781(-)
MPPMPPGMPPPEPDPSCALLNKKNKPANAITGNNTLPNKLAAFPCCSPSETEMSTPFLAKISTNSGSFGKTTVALFPFTAVNCKDEPSLANRTRSTFPPKTALMNSEYLHVAPSGNPEASVVEATVVDGADKLGNASVVCSADCCCSAAGMAGKSMADAICAFCKVANAVKVAMAIFCASLEDSLLLLLDFITVARFATLERAFEFALTDGRTTPASTFLLAAN